MFWTRELAGWILVILGIISFIFTYTVLLLSGKVVESMVASFISFIVYRGGIHLLKVAIAAKMCREPMENYQNRATISKAKKD